MRAAPVEERDLAHEGVDGRCPRTVSAVPADGLNRCQRTVATGARRRPQLAAAPDVLFAVPDPLFVVPGEEVLDDPEPAPLPEESPEPAPPDEPEPPEDVPPESPLEAEPEPFDEPDEAPDADDPDADDPDVDDPRESLR